MISVQNRQLLSNGNKLIIAIIIMAIVLMTSACGASKKARVVIVPDFPDVVIKEDNKPTTNNPPKPTTPPTNLPPKPIDPKPIDTKVDPPKPVNQSFDLAILLPFSADENEVFAESDSILEKSKIALEFYTGVNMALEELKDEHIGFNVKILDTGNDPVKSQLATSQIPKGTDLILGPLYNKEVSPVADYGLKNKIPVISPLSPSPDNLIKNPYFITVNPSISTHLKKIYDHIIGVEKASKIYVLCDNDPKEIAMADELIALAGTKVPGEAYSPMPTITKLVCDGARACMESLQATLDLGVDNHIVVTSMKEMYVNKIVSILSNVDGTYPMKVYGMPNWYKFETLNLDMLNRIDFRYTNTFWKDEYESKSKEFDAKYKAMYNAYPSDIAVKGYEITKYFGKMLATYNTDFIKHFDQQPSNGNFQKFQFGLGFSTPNKTITNPDYIENKHLYMIGYQNFQLKKL